MKRSDGDEPEEGRQLNAKRQRFVELYLISMNATEAYREAYGVDATSARANGHRLLGDEAVADAIAAAQAERSKRTQITSDMVLRRWWEIATADPRELVELRRAWEARQKKSSKEDFDEQGGDGYNATREPNPACIECFGEGVRRQFVHDTRRLSTAAAALYAGVDQTKKGLVRVRMRNQDTALENVAKHLGMFREQNGDAPSLTDEERARKIRAELEEMDRVTVAA
jgi:phage terminase small subunit